MGSATSRDLGATRMDHPHACVLTNDKRTCYVLDFDPWIGYK